jgi:hypothetical protein
MSSGITKTDKVPLCFVIGPIGNDRSPERRHSDLFLHAVIKYVLEASEFGYKVKRADEDADPGMIGDRVISDIINADLVVADLTDLNPNAFYELGIRHSTEKPTIHIAKSGTVLPFDNVAHRTIFIDMTDWDSIEHGRSRLREAARLTRAADFKVTNPITQANASFKMRQSADPRDRTIAEMQDRIASLEMKYPDGWQKRFSINWVARTRKAGPISFQVKDLLERLVFDDRPLWQLIQTVNAELARYGPNFSLRVTETESALFFEVFESDKLLFAHGIPRPNRAISQSDDLYN